MMTISESDVNFVMRVLERNSIYFHFEHTKTLHTLGLIDEGGVTNYERVKIKFPGISTRTRPARSCWCPRLSGAADTDLGV